VTATGSQTILSEAGMTPAVQANKPSSLCERFVRAKKLGYEKVWRELSVARRKPMPNEGRRHAVQTTFRTPDFEAVTKD
jgi:hypothetical protein